MAEFKPTGEQKRAIELTTPIIVSAGAGSGKTTVLTHRLLHNIEINKKSIDRFVVITFTKATATELRAKISSMIEDAAKKNPALRKQQALVRNAEIGTIHSFCASLLRANSTEAGVSPDFKIISEERAQMMMNAALKKVIDSMYVNISPEAELLINSLGNGKNDSALESAVLKLYESMNSHAVPADWANRMVNELDKDIKDIEETIWGAEILKGLKRKTSKWIDRMSLLLSELQEDAQISAKYGGSISATLDDLSDFADALKSGWDAAYNFREISFSKFGTLRNPENPELAQKVKNTRDACKNAAKGMQNKLTADSAELSKEMKASAGAVKELLKLEERFREEYSKAKDGKNLLDYSDLEHKTYKMLQDNPELAKRISAGYEEIMVDEFQDVSRVQDAIFQAVSDNGKKLFMVGDVKQSIYRFRLADPEIFIEKTKSKIIERVDLPQNYRSCNEVVNCCNHVFEHCMTAELGGVDYDDRQKLKFASLDYSDGLKRPDPEVILFECEGSAAARRKIEAGRVAAMIEKAGNFGETAILLRSMKNVAEIFSAELESRGIPVNLSKGSSIFENAAAENIFSMLKVLDNPHSDIPLIALLKSPLFSFSPDDLSEIRAADVHTDLYSALCRCGNEKCRAFKSLIDELRDLCTDLTMVQLINTICVKTGLDILCGASAQGRSMEEAIDELRSMASDFENDGNHGLHRFVIYLENIREKGGESADSAVAKANAVTITSIHKSKGLQFKTVFICDAAKEFNSRSRKDELLIHPTLGLGPKFTDTNRLIRYPTLARNAIDIRMEREDVSEEMRLLYVAMTRAKERLYITAACKDPEKTKEKALETDPEDAKNFIQWILPAYNHVRIIGEAAEEVELNPAVCDAGADEAAESLKAFTEDLLFEYPFEEAAHLPSKITATEMKEEDDEAAELVRRRKHYFRMPELSGEGRKVSPAEKGIATHLALQYMNFSAVNDVKSAETEIERLRAGRFLSQRQADCVDAEAVAALLNSPTGERMKNAENIKREFRFSLLKDAEEICRKAAGEKILLQGVVDCFLIEDGKLVIIDYKTDSVKTEEEIAERCTLYAPQVKTYASALSEILGIPVKETILCFLIPGVQKTVAL